MYNFKADQKVICNSAPGSPF